MFCVFHDLQCCLPNFFMAAQNTFLCVSCHETLAAAIEMNFFYAASGFSRRWFCHAEIVSLINGSLLYFIVSASDL